MYDAIDFLIKTITIPVLVFIIKSVLGKELNYWFLFVYYLFNRPYDLDGDPMTHDWAMIFNPGNGEWECCSLTFGFKPKKINSGVYIHHYDNQWNPTFIERIPFDQWQMKGKARICKRSRLWKEIKFNRQEKLNS